VAPAPVEPVAAPEPAPPAPQPAAAEVDGTVKVTGNATAVELLGASGRFGPGRVPPGEYRVRATFEGKGTVGAGTVTVTSGQAVELYCDAAFAKCRAR
jgi:hypothetical protein